MSLGLSQPQVSRHIGDLERTLGVTLFVRSARHTTLTGAGSELLTDARETLAAAERLVHRAGLVGRGGLGRAVSSASEALALVRAGLGLFRLPVTAAVPTAGVVYRELEGVLTRTVLLRRPEPPSPAVAAITALIEELFGDAQSASKNAVFALEGATGGA